MKRVVVTQTDNDNINTGIANAAYELGEYSLSGITDVCMPLLRKRKFISYYTNG